MKCPVLVNLPQSPRLWERGNPAACASSNNIRNRGETYNDEPDHAGEIYKNLTDDDLKAIFAFLRTPKPVKHRVNNSVAATECSSANRNTVRVTKTSDATANVRKRELCAIDIRLPALS
jgi:hypothetical protein